MDASLSSTPHAGQSFNVVPPTTSGSLKRQPLASSSREIVSEEEEAERYTNRRSIYRSSGTSSSPDLATLVRKAKERGGVVYGAHQYLKEKMKTPPPPLPPHQDRLSAGTTVSRGGLNRGALNDSIPEWFTASPFSSRDQVPKVSKSSVRQKTSALIGKMLGQYSTREKTSVTSSIIPNAIEPNMSTSPIDETSTAMGSPPLGCANRSVSPQVTIGGKQDDPDETSLVFIDPVPHSEAQGILPDTPATIITSKRRSLSVGDAYIKKSLTNVPAQLHGNDNREWTDNSLHGIINDFKGQLSSLDSKGSTPLDLQDPSTPAQCLAYRSKIGSSSVNKANPFEPNAFARGPASSDKHHHSESNMILKVDEEDAKLMEPSPIVPPRSSSLQTASHSLARLTRTNISKEIFTPSKMRHAMNFQDSNRPQVLHRPTASISEPSLVPARVSSTLTGSQHDLTATGSTLTRFASNFSINDVDIESRGRDLATKCWNEDTNFLAKEKIAEYLGGQGYINKIALRCYIALFDFSGLRLDLAFRHLCSKLYLKAETQQVDRILEEFGKRYWECNPSTLYGSASVVHAITYSILLLNTDLHVADLATHMSRSQFVRNTMTAIQAQYSSALATIANDQGGNSGTIRSGLSDDKVIVGRAKRSDSIASWNSVSRDVDISLSMPYPTHRTSETAINNETPLTTTDISALETKSVNDSQFFNRAWENEMENLLKEMYGAIRAQQILQPSDSSSIRLTTSSSGPGTGMLRKRSLRNPSDRLTTLKRGSVRGLQSIITQSGASSNSSIEGRVSPSPSLATSAHEFHCSSSSFLTPSLGFASNLSHTIIREAREDDDHSVRSEGTTSTSISISDEELALLGPPWAKEGILCRKQYWESTGKRSKDKSWLDVFVVIQRGELNMFTFGGGNTTSNSSSVIGGGNWLSNAHLVGTVHLAHSLAHSLPPPGYNRQRPYCMVLTLANGGVYFFQAGTEELVNEWVSTCNYWAARTSKEPLAGGVSNMEYGWNRISEPHVYGRAVSDDESARDADHVDSMSVRSGRSNRSRFGWREGVATVRHGSSPWADRIFINDWKVPLPPTVSSTHDEETQLEALRKHVTYLKNDLERHNELREPMMALYQSRTAQAVKAQSNWEKRSQYLLTEIVKYESYIDSLQNAMTLRLKKRGEKALERALNGVLPSSPDEIAPGLKQKFS
ncbi:hypothetical protein APHAL10511_004948 [Amanita phalloides]|nr:hypothetical protein APHAL10511_004948 [Amanita phalloides]